MTLLLAQPDTCTLPALCHAINNWLWAWSPWHLRERHRQYKAWTFAVLYGKLETLTYNHGIDTRWFDTLREPAGFKESLDRNAAKEIGLELLAKGYIEMGQDDRSYAGPSMRVFTYRLRLPPPPPNSRSLSRDAHA